MSKSPPSLRGRLMLANASLLTTCLFSFSLLLYAAFSRALAHHFDERLAADAEAIAHAIEEHVDGTWEFEGLSEFERRFADAYFEVHLDDHALFTRSHSLGARALPNQEWSEQPSVTTVSLPGGAAGRVYRAALQPRSDDPHVRASSRHVWVSVARATSELDAALASLRLLLLLSGLTVLAVASVVGVWTIGRGLKPLRRFLDRVDAIDAHRLGDRLPVHDLPHELQPMASKLNELLSRIEASLAREREWNTALSHELRTPLAGLRAIFEVGLSRERSAADYRNALIDAHQIVMQTSRLIDQLLLLARLDARAWALSHDTIQLRDLVDSCLVPQRARAELRKLHIDNRVPGHAVLVSDQDKLRLAITNLLSNAVEYSSEQGEIHIDSDLSEGCVLSVRNTGPSIPDAQLQEIFEPFVRLESSRSGTGDHGGIGLTLVRAVCRVLGFSISAESRTDGWTVFTIAAASGRAAE